MTTHTLTFEVEDSVHELFILRLASITSMEGVSVSTPQLEGQRLVKPLMGICRVGKQKRELVEAVNKQQGLGIPFYNGDARD